MSDMEPPPELQSLSDEELETAIYNKLENDGRIELEELAISCRKGKVFLEGVLSSES